MSSVPKKRAARGIALSTAPPVGASGQEHALGHPLDPEVVQLLEDLGAASLDRLCASTPEDARARVGRMRELVGPGPDVAAVEELRVPGPAGDVPVRRYRASAEGDGPVALYLHGGGWVLGGLDESDALCRHLVAASGCDVLSVGYRLAPEHPFPAGLEDADAALRWLADRCPGRPVVLVGDSAGANLAAVLARRARDRGGPRIAMQVLVYPVTDHRMTSRSFGEVHGLLLDGDDMRWFWDLYAPAPEDRASVDASPLDVGDLGGLPPALVLIAEHDPLRDEGLAYARRLVDAGVDVTVDRYVGMIHGFFPLIGLLSAARTAVDSVGAAVAAAG